MPWSATSSPLYNVAYDPAGKCVAGESRSTHRPRSRSSASFGSLPSASRRSRRGTLTASNWMTASTLGRYALERAHDAQTVSRGRDLGIAPRERLELQREGGDKRTFPQGGAQPASRKRTDAADLDARAVALARPALHVCMAASAKRNLHREVLVVGLA